MRRLSIKASLIIVTLGLVFAFGLMAWSSIRTLKTIGETTQDLVTNGIPSLSRSKEINVSLGDLRIAYRNHILAGTPEEKAVADERVKAIQKLVQGNLASYAEVADAPIELAGLREITNLLGQYNQLGDTMRAFSTDHKDAEAKAVLKEMVVITGKIDKEIDQIVALNEQEATKLGKATKDTVESSITLTLIASVVIGLVGLGAVVFTITCVASPLNHIADAMKTLAGGNTDNVVPYRGRTDEIGSMAAAVEVFREAAIANKRLEREAEESRKHAEIEREETQRRAEAEAAERLRIATSGLAAGLKRLASGDLTFQLNEAFAPDFEPLREDFNQSVAQLGSVLASIAGAASSIDNGTREIAAGANDLSRRTEQQAASLEETAAAVEQITANVQSSSKRSEEARRVAKEANLSASQSSEVVANAEGAMKRIETSSEQISNIIGVIDEIAFQTNLLALNAGVEAARAGEAGKGFAVVAQEVRELAQRAAQAAKEIKGLIQNSSAEVENGVRLVRDAGTALKTIGSFITEMNSHMEAIATSAREQSTGLVEVNQAVNAMDQTTQQNAAMVEQSNAASSTLAQEAMKLRDLITQFQLPGTGVSQVAELRNVARAMATPAAPSPARPGRATPQAAVKKVASGGSATHWDEF